MKKALLSLAAFAARLIPMTLKRSIYRSPGLSSIIRGGLNRAAPRGLVDVSVAAGALEGIWIGLDLQSEKDYWLGTYEPALQAAILDLVEPGMVAYDLGANIGYITLQLARAVGVGGHVYAFEALPENIERLQANISLNEMDIYVTVIPRAVSDSSGHLNFLVGPSAGTGKVSGSAGRQDLSYSQQISVETVSLDSFVYEQGYPGPNVIKIDIEGGELLALPGMRRVLSEERPVVFLELHGFDAAQMAWDELLRARYRICRMAPGYEQVPRFDDLDWKSYLVAQPK
jgi:FkbM family methyltransferase